MTKIGTKPWQFRMVTLTHSGSFTEIGISERKVFELNAASRQKEDKSSRA